MKKFLSVFIIAIAGVIFGGCAPKVEVDQVAYPWEVVLVMQFELVSETVPANAVANLKQALGTEDIIHAQDILQVALAFEDYSDFATYFNFDAEDYWAVDRTITEKTFLVERTMTFENPWKTAFDHGSTTVNWINAQVRTQFGSVLVGGAGAEPNYFYLFVSTYRRSEVPNTVATDYDGAYYDYVFAYNNPDAICVDEILVFDRFSNSPIWYVIAIGATAIAMGIAYIIFAKRRKKVYNSEWPLQSSPTFTET